MLLDCRHDFHGFGDWTYLNAAFHGPMPRVAEDALAAAVELRRNPSLIRNEYHFTFPDAYRAAVAPLVGADPARIALTDSATAGTMLLVAGLDWHAGDQVVIPRGEFPSNRLPFQALSDEGVTLMQVDLAGATSPEDRLVAALTPRTRVLLVSWVSYLDGRRLDLDALSDACRARGVLFAVDGSQGAGGLPIDLGRTRCDLFICAGYKWLLGPYGLGFVVVAPDLTARLRPGNINWFASRGAEDFNRLADLSWRPVDDARRFDANEPASFFNVAAGTASARYIGSLTPEAIEAHVRALQDHLVARLPAGFSPLGLDAPLRSNILCFTGPDTRTTAGVFRYVRSRRIAVSSRESAIRVSPHVYNTVEQIDALVQALADALDGRDLDRARPAQDEALDGRLRTLLGLADRAPVDG